MANQEPAKKAEPVKVLRVLSKSQAEMFRRAGYGFSSAEPTDIPMSKLTAAQVAAIKTEPMLVAVETMAEAKA